MQIISMHSPVGDLSVFAADDQIVALDWGWSPEQLPGELTREAKRQLDAYFDGDLEDFDLPMNPSGTTFQNSIWRQMLAIPYGETRTYGDLAKTTGSAAQAVGNACGANPIPILIPCHRVLAAGGKMGGYSGEGGLVTKKALLVLEGAIPLEADEKQASLF